MDFGFFALGERSRRAAVVVASLFVTLTFLSLAT
jgi:hypothetical protein